MRSNRGRLETGFCAGRITALIVAAMLMAIGCDQASEPVVQESDPPYTPPERLQFGDLSSQPDTNVDDEDAELNEKLLGVWKFQGTVDGSNLSLTRVFTTGRGYTEESVTETAGTTTTVTGEGLWRHVDTRIRVAVTRSNTSTVIMYFKLSGEGDLVDAYENTFKRQQKPAEILESSEPLPDS